MSKLMCHVVAGYPDAKTCVRLMRGMQELRVAAIEVQIPFSDPIADGGAIMQANDVALEGGMTTAGSFNLIKLAREQGVDCDIYIMSYLQKVQHFGLEAFCKEASSCGVKGLIIPDMPYESPEYALIAEHAAKNSLELVPVLSPGMPGERLKTLLQTGPSRIYVTSQRGITGNAYSGTEELKRFIGDVRNQSEAIVMVGFGIKSPADVSSVLKFGDMAVVGSAIINRLKASDPDKTLGYIKTLTGAASEA